MLCGLPLAIGSDLFGRIVSTQDPFSRPDNEVRG